MAAGGAKASNAKHYIMAGLTATLAAAVVVTVVSVVLSPARVSFSVTDARSVRSGNGGGGEVQLILTLAATNPSRRAAVTYRSMFVDVSNSTVPGEWVNWIRASLPATDMPLRQPCASVKTIDATVSLVGGPWAVDFTGNMTSNFTVMVTALAQFKVGIAPTRLYDIKVACGPVSFFSRAGGSSAAAAGRPPVDCHSA
ncbi:hypothetical protein ACP70R_041959 [Stipagrostis hirtigluma subsp. patula]